jgi:LysR family hydrogen peroxide-inducible transcriptional activator
MTLTELRYVVALFETRHFGNAAEQCNVSQPTLSIAIKKLEAELGVSLFERSRQQLAATPVGEKIVAQARVVIRESQHLTHLAEMGKDPLGAMLSVGAIYTVGPYLFPRLVSGLQDSAPEMPLYIEESYTADLRRKLSAGELDAIFVALPFTEPDVVTRAMFQESFVVVVPVGHPLARKKRVAPGSLAKYRVILLGDGHCFREQVLLACPGLGEAVRESHNRGQAILDGSSLETLKHMVASGLGITVLPASAVGPGQYDGDRLVVREFENPAPGRTVALAWRASYPRPQAIDVLADTMRE